MATNTIDFLSVALAMKRVSAVPCAFDAGGAPEGRSRSPRASIAGTSGMTESHTSSMPTKPMVPNWLKPRKFVIVSDP